VNGQAPARPADLIVFSKAAYSIPNFALEVDLSVESIRIEIEAGRLVPSYVRTKPLITAEEGLRWLRSLPPERAA
jgi:hypothetical protein